MTAPLPPSAPAPFLPTSAEEVRALGWEAPDVVFVSGDAYVDHPSFAAAVLGRTLEAHGFRVAILPQPDWRSTKEWLALGRPRLCYAVSAGNMDSMINHYTANRKRRNDDAYSPGGRIGLRPDRPTNVYAQRCREAFPGVPVVIGGVEASLRRIAHYDYWSDTVRQSILATSKADLLGYGMGEAALVAIASRLAAGEPVTALRDLRGVAYLLGRNEQRPEHRFGDGVTLELPAYEAVREDRVAFAHMTRMLHQETNPLNARRLVQRHGDRLLVVNPPALPLTEAELDAIYDLPYQRVPHPRYREPIPAHQMIQDSVTIMRGCFGGCTFCSITMHQGRAIQSRSERSILREVQAIAVRPGFKGYISDLGGPTANMYRMRCTRPEVEAVCRRQSCVHPTVCRLLGTDHRPTIDLLRAARAVPGVKRIHVSSGIRMDLAVRSPEYIREIAAHHVSGHLKVAPEHVAAQVLEHMKKPAPEHFDAFAGAFASASAAVGKEQYLVPYFIASHPGSGVKEMIELAVFLKVRGYRPRQVQDFIPAPMDVATCMYWTGLDPFTMQPVETVKRLRDRVVQRALMQFFAPRNWFVVRKALLDHGRADLIGDGPECLIRAEPPPEALAARREAAERHFVRTGSRAADDEEVEGDLEQHPEAWRSYVHAPQAGTSERAGPAAYRRGARLRGRHRRRPER
ncbi:MAG: YgiQ family radical SAM protein [Planctomycetes bacterium]|nr:YgiQ family radical SAM protein [Planctomycetota bacterium]